MTQPTDPDNDGDNDAPQFPLAFGFYSGFRVNNAKHVRAPRGAGKGMRPARISKNPKRTGTRYHRRSK